MGQGWNRALSALTLAGALALAACGQGGSAAKPNTTYQETLIQQLIDAKPGAVITIPAGVYAIDRGLSLQVDGVTIKGAGMDKTVLTFKGQTAGAEGLLVNASNFTIEDLAIEDAKGDALKVNEGENIIIRRVRTEWTGGPKTTNGAYGIYPVQVRNLLIEDSVAIGASDAGIYVGQSNTVVVRRNRAEFNVAGIEIENTQNADVYDNLATNNTGGILVFNMPNLKVSGFATRIFRNRVEGNNTKNFGLPGSAVASVPAGTGVIINSNDQVEIFDNDIGGNNTANVIISSYFSTGYMTKDGVAPNFDAWPEAIFIHDNRFTPGGSKPDGLELQALRVALFGVTGRLPDVLWDGYVDVKKFKGGKLDPALAICVDNGAAQTLNADGPNKNKSPALAGDQVRCRLTSLPAITVAAAGPVPAERKVPARQAVKRLLAILLVCLLGSCSPETLEPRFVADGAPEALSDWGMVGVRGRRLILAKAVQPYELNTPLFTDYAGKLRTLWMPQGQSAGWTPDAAFDFPVGTVVTKTFFYPKGPDGSVTPGDDLPLSTSGEGLDLDRMRLIETRVLVRRAGGWVAFPYVWNDAQTRATLKRTGQPIPMTLTRPGRRDAFVYQVPNVNQCAGCHATDHAAKALLPIGLKSRHLDREVTLAGAQFNQLDRLATLGYLRGLPPVAGRVRAPDWKDETAPLAGRARAWLDINCGHCHSPRGPADTSGLFLDTPTPMGPSLGLCKPPVAAGQGTGGFSHGIEPGKPDQSILIFRTASTAPGAMMPELGRALAHDEGLALLRRWIAAMPAGCR